MKRGFDALTTAIVFAGGTLVFLCTAVAVDKERDAKPLVTSSSGPIKPLVVPQASEKRNQLNWFSRPAEEVDPSAKRSVPVSDAGVAVEAT